MFRMTSSHEIEKEKKTENLGTYLYIFSNYVRHIGELGTDNAIANI